MNLFPGIEMNQLTDAARILVVCLSVAGSSAFGQSASSIDPPMFRPRSDAMATRDADAIRERLKALSDSLGPINPLGDYVKPSPKIASSDRDQVDEEALRAPSLDADAQRRLKARPPSVAESERYAIGLYPPPQIRSNSGKSIPGLDRDDGFRPVTWVAGPMVASPVAASPIVTTSGMPPIRVPVGGYVVQANYQVGDPAAMIRPSLGGSSVGLPTYSAPPSSVPAMNPPPMGAPPIGAPATVMPPSGSYGGGPAGVPMVGAPGSNVIPAPPTYIVPGPNSPYTAPAVPAPYAAPAPTYSRSSGTVNSLPFVSPPPQARDARWMVSPEVYRRMDGANCATPTAPAYGAAAAGSGAGSPFFYAPPAAMPMPTPRTASRHSWLHPFRH
jgi:hypothetical protein